MAGRCGRPPKALDGACSAQAFLGAELRRIRADGGLVIARLAELVGYSTQHLGAVERGTVLASEQVVTACDAVLGADGYLVGLFHEALREQAAARHQLRAARRLAEAEAEPSEPAGADAEVDWGRLETVIGGRMRPSPAVVDDLALITDRHRSLYHQLPASQMIDRVVAHPASLRTMVKITDGVVQRQLAALAQESAGLVAWLRHNLGEVIAGEAAYRVFWSVVGMVSEVAAT